jgi:chaperonin cofactor prefoldin
MEFAFYAIGITMAILGAVVWIVYQQLESVDQHMYQQNNEFRNRINAMQSDVDNLRKRIDTLRAELDKEESEDE